MPDSPWTNPTKADGDAYEARHANGQPPEGFHRLNRDFSETDYQNGARIVRETDTYADWTAQPAPDAVRDSCDWCNQYRRSRAAARVARVLAPACRPNLPERAHPGNRAAPLSLDRIQAGRHSALRPELLAAAHCGPRQRWSRVDRRYPGQGLPRRQSVHGLRQPLRA
jgi:hypothetical protein